MQTENLIAFKEWSVVCAALLQGRQTILLRKGGVHEGREGFRVAHDEFWLFPTWLHQSEGDERVQPEARDLLLAEAAHRPPAGEIPLPAYAVVQHVYHLLSTQPLPRLEPWHVLSRHTVDERFHYREPGLFVLDLRIYRPGNPIVIPDSPHFAGCRSWVELPAPLATEGLTPVLSDAEAAKRSAELHEVLAPPAFA